MQTVQENLEPIPWRYHPHCTPLPSTASYEEHVACRPMPEVQAWPPVADKIAVYHFIVKSEEDFRLKVKRGSGGGTHRSWEHFQEIVKCVSERNRDGTSHVHLTPMKMRPSAAAAGKGTMQYVRHCKLELRNAVRLRTMC